MGKSEWESLVKDNLDVPVFKHTLTPCKKNGFEEFLKLAHHPDGMFCHGTIFFFSCFFFVGKYRIKFTEYLCRLYASE